MKKILVLTDLSDQSFQATEAAVILSAKINANLVLFNTFISQPALSEYGGEPWSVQEFIWEDEVKKKLGYLKEQTEQLVDTLPAVAHHASIDCRRGVGALGPQVREILETDPVELVVMGARKGSIWDHLLLGSDTLSVINLTSRPVMIIPSGHPLKQLKKVTMATDFDDADLNAVYYLTRLGRLFDFTIEIVHVKLWGEKNDRNEQKAKFEKQIARFNFPNISYREISGKELINRLNDLCRSNSSDILVLVHDRQSLLDRLFNGSNAKSLLEKQECPVMIIPAGMAVI